MDPCLAVVLLRIDRGSAQAHTSTQLGRPLPLFRRESLAVIFEPAERCPQPEPPDRLALTLALPHYRLDSKVATSLSTKRASFHAVATFFEA